MLIAMLMVMLMGMLMAMPGTRHPAEQRATLGVPTDRTGNRPIRAEEGERTQSEALFC